MKLDIKRSIKNSNFGISVSIMIIATILGAGFKLVIPEYAQNGIVMYYHCKVVLRGIQSDIV